MDARLILDELLAREREAAELRHALRCAEADVARLLDENRKLAAELLDTDARLKCAEAAARAEVVHTGLAVEPWQIEYFEVGINRAGGG